MPALRKPKLITHIPSFQDVPSFEFTQVITASSMWHDLGKGDDVATFDLTVREMPGRRNFMLFSGVEEIVTGLLNWKYDQGFLRYLTSMGAVSKSFARYLKNFTFTGDLYTLPEGTVFFPGEPVVRITAMLKDANLFTNFLAMSMCYPTLFFSKAVRVKLASRGKIFEVAGAMRTNGFENSLKLQRLSHILGSSTAILYLSHKEKLQNQVASMTFYHALIKSFPNEVAAFRAVAAFQMQKAIKVVMVDTYNFQQGVENYIRVEKEANARGQSIGWILLDSGNILQQARYLRRKLDAAGLQATKIGATSNLNEYSIHTLERAKAPIDAYGALTEVVTVADRPVLEAVYKLAEVRDARGNVHYTAKLTPGKLSLPGRKQIFRRLTRGQMQGDVVGLETEKLGTPLLVPYIRNGRLTRTLPTLAQVRKHVDEQLAQLPPRLRSVTAEGKYPVHVSARINAILKQLRKKHGRG